MADGGKAEIEETSLPAHVALCRLRHQEIARRMTRIEAAVYAVLVVVLLGGEKGIEIVRKVLAAL